MKCIRLMDRNTMATSVVRVSDDKAAQLVRSGSGAYEAKWAWKAAGRKYG